MATFVPFVLLLLTQSYTPSAQGAPCAVSQDPTYGFSRDNPVQVGGGALYAKAREQRYLEALQAPTGKPLTYKRQGSSEGPRWDGRYTFIDIYEITWEGAEKSLTLYLDAYRYWEPVAPAGFTCARPFNLQPILDTFLAMESLFKVALQPPPASIAPIPIDVTDKTARGGIWDGFRLLALGAPQSSAISKPTLPGMLVLAYPLSCEGRTVVPTGIDVLQPQGTSVRGLSAPVDPAIEKLLAGVKPPAGSVAARFQMSEVRPGQRIRITYAEPACPQGSTEATLPLTYSPARPIEMAQPRLPEGAKPGDSRVLLQVIVDLEGRLQLPHYAGGPPHLREPAIEAVTKWRAEPARVNGAPVATAMLVVVQFN